MQPTMVITKTNLICGLGYDLKTVMNRLYQGDQGLQKIILETPIDNQSKILFGKADFDFKHLLGGKGWRNTERHSMMACLGVKALKNKKDETGAPFDRGIILGCDLNRCPNEFKEAVMQKEHNLINPMLGINRTANAVASLVAIKEQLSGLNFTITTGFTSGLEAFYFSQMSIAGKRVKVVFIGAVQMMLPELVYAFATNSQTNKSSRVFSHHQPGQVIAGEGGGLLRVMSQQTALDFGEPILATYLGFGLASASRAADNNCATVAINQALMRAGCEPKDIDAVFLSANGNEEQDQSEDDALGEIFSGKLPAVAIKGALGETFYAGGALAAVVAVEAIQRNELPPTAHLNDSSAYKSCILSDQIQECNLRRVLVLSLDRTKKACAIILGKDKKNYASGF